MSTSSTNNFGSLPARPPTPPKELANAIDDAISFLDDSNEVERLLSKSVTGQKVLNASEITPSSSQESTSLAYLAKKVGFSPHPIYHNIPLLGQSSSPSAALLKRSPSAAKHTKPLKSILKLPQAPPPTPDDLESKLSYFSPADPGSFAKMLQSVCQLLGSSSRSVRFDAYANLNNTLKAYDNVPDTTAMLQKMRLLMQFLSRDIVWKETADILDSQIVTQALNLTLAILYNPNLAGALDDDFGHFLIDRCLAVLESSNAPKQVVKAHMGILSQQRFKPHVMNSGRADRVLHALQSIEDRYSGNSIVAARLTIYTRLLEQAPAVMLSKANEWLEYVFHGMLSSIKDVRIRAIDTCTHAGLYLGQQAHASKVLIELFETELEDGQTYFDFFKARLLQMISDNEIGHYVPQIWSAIILMFRSKKMPLYKWTQLSSSLMIIQKCLNASDLKIRYQAMLAWNKFVFAIMPNSSTPQSKMTMLPQPMISAMERLTKDKTTKYVRQYALDSYCNLLHYGLRPGLSVEELDNAWESFVQPVLSGLIKAKGKGRQTACRVLHGLLNGNTGVWNGNAALDPTPIKPGDLPKLDPKWVRSRLAKFLKVLEPAVLQDMWHPNGTSSAVDATWNSLMQALANARSQEVRTTMELKEAIALLVAFFRRVWEHFTPLPDQNPSMDRYVSFLDAMMTGTGTSSFVEDILATTDDNAVEVAPTPSHRSSKRHSAPTSPLVILLDQFYRVPTGLSADGAYFTSALTILNRALSSRVTLAASLDLLRRSLHTWKDTSGPDVEPGISREMWIVVAKASIRVLNAELKRSATQETQPLGHALRNGMDILGYGLELDARPRLLNTMLEFYDALVEVARFDASDGGVVLAVTEPLAKLLTDADSSLPFSGRLHLTTRMLQSTIWPKNRQVLDQARKSLWGIAIPSAKVTAFDPYEHMYSLIVEVMTSAYDDDFASAQGTDLEALGSLLTSVLSFLRASPVSLLVTSVRKVQLGFTTWIEDTAQKTNADEQVAKMLRSAWRSLIRLLTSIPTKDNYLLKALEPLLVAGFSSPHRAIVNETIVFWNATFGAEESLEYPTKLEAVLRARRADMDISLPTFPDDDMDNVPATLPVFFESQSQEPTKLQPPKLIGALGSALLSPRHQQNRPHSSHLATKSSPINRSIVSPSPARRAKATSLTPKPRLRHDDSQIQFAPIESSPLLTEDESQLLTDHQREVKARQHLDAQLFPGLFSSPLAHSTALPKRLPKKLDFGSRISPRQQNESYGTPTGLGDGNMLASDDMPSSPTPSSTKDASQGAMELDDDQDEDAVVVDPPSSPPRASYQNEKEREEDFQTTAIVDPDDTAMDITPFPDPQPDGASVGNQGEIENHTEGADVPETDEMFSASEFPSESILPDEQLQMENELARNAQEVPSNRLDDTQQRISGDTVPDDVSQEHVTEVAEDEVTRVEDSFVQVASPTESQAIEDGESTPRANKKRKRRSSKHKASKKQHQQSPLQRVWSTLGFGRQHDDDDDMGEDIVVGSSQAVPSPTTERAGEEKDVGEEEDEAEQDDVVAVERSMVVKHEPEVMPPPAKRGRGRPPKSKTPTSSQTETASAKSVKRKASLLSNTSFDDDYTPTSVVKDTPAPGKAKGRLGRPARRGSSSQYSQASREQSQSRPSSRGSSVAVAVLIPQTAVSKKRVVEEESAVVQDRPMLTPRSIFGRLKGALSDFKGMILGPQEEREFDDLLFGWRQEVHEAGRRGREAQ